jgi:hypothetical protein
MKGFKAILEELKNSYESVFWESCASSKEHADTLLKCATDIYIAQQGQTQIVIKREEK